VADSDNSKSKPPALDQAQAMSVVIPGALNAAAMVVDTPAASVTAPAETPPAAAPAAPSAPMLVDVPVELVEVTPDPEPDDGRPAPDAHKANWAAWAISRGVPSYHAWAMTVPELKKLEA
jgi:hypothetical protein